MYSEYYTKKIIDFLPDINKTIKDVDELCSVIYSSAFVLFLMYMYMVLIGGILIMISVFVEKTFNIGVLKYILYAIGGLLLFPVLLSMLAPVKKLHGNQKVQKLLFKNSKFSSALIMGPLYKHLMQISLLFTSNFKKKKSISYMMIAFFLVGFVTTDFKFKDYDLVYLIQGKDYFDKTKIEESYYKSSEENPSFLLAPQITSDVIKQDVLKVFIPIFSHERQIRKSICPKYESNDALSKSANGALERQSYLDCYQSYHEVLLNGIKIPVSFKK